MTTLQTHPVSRGRGLTLALLGMFLLVVMMDNTIVNVALRAIQDELGASNAQLQWAVDSYILVYAALMFPAGIIADRYGRKRVLLVGLAIFGVASALSAFASTPDQLILWRAVMGLGGAVVRRQRSPSFATPSRSMSRVRQWGYGRR